MEIYNPSFNINSVKLNCYILYTILAFIYIFGPVLNKYGPWFDVIFFLSTIITLLNLRDIKYLNKNITHAFILVFFLYFFLSLRILTYPSLTLNSWLSVVMKPLRIVFTIWAGLFIGKFYVQRRVNFSNLIGFIYLSILLHSIIMIFQFYSIEFRNFVYTYTTSGEFRSTFEYDFRMGGLSGGSGGSVLSVVQSLGLILSPFLLFYQKKSISKLLIFVSSLAILFSIIICGRSGLYALILFLPYSLYLVYGKVKSIKYSVFIFSLSIVSFIIFSKVILSNNTTDFFNSFYRTFDSFIELQETGKYENSTVTIVKNFILFPDFVTFMVGDNDALLNHDIERNLDSDIGYVRNIFSFGFFGLLIYSLPILFLLRLSFIKMKNGLEYKVLFLLILIMLLFHSKESE